MAIKPLRYFLAIAKLASFTRAAEQLNVAQPAVSMAIKKLENELGLTLFHRKEGRVDLTDEGRLFARHAERIVQAVDDAALEMSELKSLQQGEVRIGVSNMIGSYYFPAILMAFRHKYPTLTLKVIEGGTGKLQQMLENGELDLSVIVADDNLPDSIESYHLIKEEMRVAMAPDHPFSLLDKVTPEQFLDEELVMFKEGYIHRHIIETLALKANKVPKIGFETNLIPLIKAITKQGYGISTFLAMVIEPNDELITRPFDPAIWLNLEIAWRKDGYLSQANRAFLAFVCEQAGAKIKKIV